MVRWLTLPELKCMYQQRSSLPQSIMGEEVKQYLLDVYGDPSIVGNLGGINAMSTFRQIKMKDKKWDSFIQKLLSCTLQLVQE